MSVCLKGSGVSAGGSDYWRSTRLDRGQRPLEVHLSSQGFSLSLVIAVCASECAVCVLHHLPACPLFLLYYYFLGFEQGLWSPDTSPETETPPPQPPCHSQQRVVCKKKKELLQHSGVCDHSDGIKGSQIQYQVKKVWITFNFLNFLSVTLVFIHFNIVLKLLITGTLQSLYFDELFFFF